MKVAIVTGTSKGLGEALAYQLLDEGWSVFCIARSQSERLIQYASDKHLSLNYIIHDLSRLESLNGLMEAVFESLPASVQEFCLINNAGVLSPIKPAGKANSQEVIQNLAINCEAPILLSSAFIQLTNRFTAKCTVISISSGAGKKPYYGWSSYCSAKAAVDMFTRCAALEQAKEEKPVKLLSFAPGIMDTDMQSEIRASRQEDFEQLERFKAFKEKGELKSPEYAAQKVIRLLSDDRYQNGQVLDIKDVTD